METGPGAPTIGKLGVIRRALAFGFVCAVGFAAFVGGTELLIRWGPIDIRVSEGWIRDDLPGARDLARATSKPLFVVARCVP